MTCVRAIALVMLAASVLAQQAGGDAGNSARVTFTLDFPQSNPSHYSLAVEGNGHARYECTCSVAADSTTENYTAEFEMSQENRGFIFDWARQAKFFSGKIDSGNAKLAFTGTKELSYTDAQRSNSARYNYSNLEPVRQLTALFQKIAVAQEYGYRLAYYHHYQKLALDEELKHMEAQAENHELSEIHGVAPVLQEIVDDASVINVVRARAKELIDMKYDGSPWR
jgi:hypothetical protein